jgi:hypothetical protein
MTKTITLGGLLSIAAAATLVGLSASAAPATTAQALAGGDLFHTAYASDADTPTHLAASVTPLPAGNPYPHGNPPNGGASPYEPPADPNVSPSGGVWSPEVMPEPVVE